MLTALEKLPADRFATAARVRRRRCTRPTPAGPDPAGARATVEPGRAAAGVRRLRDPVVLGLAAMAVASALIAARHWRERRARRAGADVVRFTHSRAAERQHQRARVQHPGGLTGRPHAGLRRPGRGPAPAAHGPRAGRRHGPAAAGNRGRRLSVLLARRPVGRLHPRQPDLQDRRGRRARLRLLGMAPGTFNGSSWSTTGVLVVSGNTALYTIPEAGGPPRLLGDRATVPASCFATPRWWWTTPDSVIYASWASSSLTGAPGSRSPHSPRARRRCSTSGASSRWA